MFQGRLNGRKVFSGLQGYLKEFERKFQKSFKCVARVFQESFKGVLGKLLRCFKEVSRVF